MRNTDLSPEHFLFLANSDAHAHTEKNILPLQQAQQQFQ
jgi:hypothetical protein